MTPQDTLTDQVSWLLSVTERIRGAVATVIEGKAEVIDWAIVALLAEGHLLIEDVPGVGKTQLAKALAAAVGGHAQRIQFTPDLLPSDITGVSIFNTETRHFEFRPGGVFANIVIGDEINRASPKTQSALLEAMAERRVTIDGTTHPLPSPFLVVATQNPIELEGTYPLPEAQRDRFMLRLDMGYPSPEAESAMLEHHGTHNPLDDVTPVTTIDEVRELIDVVRHIYVHQSLKDYLVAIVGRTRTDPLIRMGGSPRASLQLMTAAKALAAIHGRHFVIPDDIAALAVPVLAHRILLTPDAQLSHTSASDLVSQLTRSVPVPARR